MLTAGDVEFEPAQSKIWQLSSSAFVMLSGDSAIQTELMMRVDSEIKNRILAAPDAWVPVKEMATLYCRCYRGLLRERAEADILHPLGLDLSSFFTKQSQMQSDLVSNLAERLIDYSFDSPIETLFLGKDNDGPLNALTGEKLIYTHIYATDKDKLTNLTVVGFGAIGIGKFHAESQFMFSGHWPSKPFHETLLLAYAAKKRAESAPGVGKDTDLIIVGPPLGSNLKASDQHIAALEKIYQKNLRSTQKAVSIAQNETRALVDEVRTEQEEETKKAMAIAEAAKETKDAGETLTS